MSGADTVGDVITAINNAGVGSISASIGPGGLGLQLTGGAGDEITVNEVGGGTTASDLGILQVTGAGAGVPVTRELGENEALYSNRKIREVLGFREEHDWRKYVKG